MELGRVRAEMRVAALALLDGYKTANPAALLNTYPARPNTIAVRSAFVDAINESEIAYTPAGMQRTPEVLIRFVRGTFGTADVAEANDALVDGFIAYVVDNMHAAGANTLSLITSVEDDDGWTPEWITPPEGAEPRSYFTTLLTLGGEGLLPGTV